MDSLALDIDFLINNPEIRAAVAQARADISGLSNSAIRESDRMNDSFKRLSSTMAGLMSAAAVKSFVTELINVRGEFQQLEIAFTTILQSKEKADALMAEVVTLASKTPFSLKDAAQGAKQLLAYGTASESVVSTLTMLGNVASGVSAPLNDIVYLYGTLQASGRVTQMDINQFAGRGIPIYKALADVLGKNTTEIKDLVSAGKVGFPEIQAAFERMTGSGGQFYNLMEAQSKSLTGQISNLGDAWDQMLNDIGKSQQGLLSGGIATIASLVENYQTIIDILKVLIVTYGVYRTALIANMLATSGMTVVELLHYGALVLAEKAQKLLNLTTAANPYVAVATALGALVAALIIFSDKVDLAVKSQENLNSIRETATKITIEQKQKLQDLIKIANNETMSLQDREAALRKINQISPEFLGSLTLAKLRTEEGRKAIEDYNRSIDLMALKQASFDKRVDIQKQKAELLSGNAEDKIGNWERIKANFRTGKSGTFNNAEYERTRKQQAADFDKQLKDIDAYETNEIAKYNAKKPKNLKSEIKRTVSVIDEEIKSKKDAQDNVSTNREHVKLQKEINQLEAEKARITGKVNKVEQKQGNDRLTFLNKLAEKEAEVKRKGLEKDQSEIQKAQKGYEDLRKKADKLKLGDGVKERINITEKTEVGYLKYDQDTEELKETLEKQKKLYADFEEYKKVFGELKAKERFAQQIDTEKSFSQWVEKQIPVSNGKTGLSGAESKRKEVLVKELENIAQLKKDAQDKDAATAFEAAKTHMQKLADIERDYQKLVKDLGENASAEQIAVLTKDRDKKMQAENAAALDSETNWANMFASFEYMSAGSVRKHLNSLRERVIKERELNNLSQEDFLQKLKAIDSAMNDLGRGNNSFANVIKALDKWRDAPKGSDAAKNAFKAVGAAASNAANDVNSIIGDVAKGLDSLGIGGEGLQDTLKSVMGIVDGIGGIGKGIATGNPVDIVKGSVTLLTSAIELFNVKDKRLQKKIEGYQKVLDSLGNSFKQLERDITDSVGESYYSDSAKAIQNLQQQQKQYQQMLDAERNKKKADQGKIKEYQNAINDIPNQIADINKAISQNLVQTSFKDLANNLADAFSEAFKSGEDAAGRFDEVFNQVIQNAVKNSLKLKLIEKPVAEFTDALAAYMKGNGNSVAGFDFEKWKGILKSAGDSMTNSLQGFGDFFKKDLTAPVKDDTKTLSNSIKGITADQADLLAGRMGSIQLSMLENKELNRQGNVTAMEQLGMMKQTALTLVKIEDNTNRSATAEENYLPYLKEIAGKLNNKNNQNRAIGG